MIPSSLTPSPSLASHVSASGAHQTPPVSSPAVPVVVGNVAPEGIENPSVAAGRNRATTGAQRQSEAMPRPSQAMRRTVEDALKKAVRLGMTDHTARWFPATDTSTKKTDKQITDLVQTSANEVKKAFNACFSVLDTSGATESNAMLATFQKSLSTQLAAVDGTALTRHETHVDRILKKDKNVTLTMECHIDDALEGFDNASSDSIKILGGLAALQGINELYSSFVERGSHVFFEISEKIKDKVSECVSDNKTCPGGEQAAIHRWSHDQLAAKASGEEGKTIASFMEDIAKNLAGKMGDLGATSAEMEQLQDGFDRSIADGLEVGKKLLARLSADEDKAKSFVANAFACLGLEKEKGLHDQLLEQLQALAASARNKVNMDCRPMMTKAVAAEQARRVSANATEVNK